MTRSHSGLLITSLQRPSAPGPVGRTRHAANLVCNGCKDQRLTGVLFTPSKRTLSAHPRGLLGKAFANARREHSAHTPADSWARLVLTRRAFAYCRDAWARPRRPATVESTEEGRLVLHATVRKAEVQRWGDALWWVIGIGPLIGCYLVLHGIGNGWYLSNVPAVTSPAHPILHKYPPSHRRILQHHPPMPAVGLISAILLVSRRVQMIRGRLVESKPDPS